MRAFLALTMTASFACAQGEVTKEALYKELESEHQLYDSTVRELQEEMKTIVKTIKETIEPAGGPDALNVAPRTPEQEKSLEEAQARARSLVDRMLEEEFRHRRRVLELLDKGRDLLRAELAALISQGKIPTGTLRDLLMPPGSPRVEVPPADGNDKQKSLFDERDEEDETLE